jgi:hypothetical protein
MPDRQRSFSEGYNVNDNRKVESESEEYCEYRISPGWMEYSDAENMDDELPSFLQPARRNPAHSWLDVKKIGRVLDYGEGILESTAIIPLGDLPTACRDTVLYFMGQHLGHVAIHLSYIEERFSVISLPQHPGAILAGQEFMDELVRVTGDTTVMQFLPITQGPPKSQLGGLQSSGGISRQYGDRGGMQEGMSEVDMSESHDGPAISPPR